MNVSIVVPTFERPELLRRLLRSIYAQTYSAYEVIVIDDFSANIKEYENVIAEFSLVFQDFSFLRNSSNRGAPHSRNHGIRHAKYDLVALVDDDDEWLPHKLAKQVEVFTHSPPIVGLVYTWTDVVDLGVQSAFYRAETEGKCLHDILKECFIPSPSVMLRKAVFSDVGFFDEQLPSCQDWDMWTRIFANGYECRVVREALTLYHKQASSSIGTSPRARHGYAMYYRRHYLKLLRYGQWRHLVRFFRLSVGI